MKESRNPTTPETSASNGSEFGVVTIDFNPGPDSRDRLRRLFSLLMEHAAALGQPASVEDRPGHGAANGGAGE